MKRTWLISTRVPLAGLVQKPTGQVPATVAAAAAASAPAAATATAPAPASERPEWHVGQGVGHAASQKSQKLAQSAVATQRPAAAATTATTATTATAAATATTAAATATTTTAASTPASTTATAAATTSTAATAAEGGWTGADEPTVPSDRVATHAILVGDADADTAADVDGVRYVFRRHRRRRRFGRRRRRRSAGARVAGIVDRRRLRRRRWRRRRQQFLGRPRLPRAVAATCRRRVGSGRGRLRSQPLGVENGRRGARLHVHGRLDGFHGLDGLDGIHVVDEFHVLDGIHELDGHVADGHVHGRHAVRLPVAQPVAGRLPWLRRVGRVGRRRRWIRRRRRRRRLGALLQ